MAMTSAENQRAWSVTHGVYWPLLVILCVGFYVMNFVTEVAVGLLSGVVAAASGVPEDVRTPPLIVWIGFGLGIVGTIAIGAYAFKTLLSWRLSSVRPQGSPQSIEGR